jgi:hypothetical protein
MSRGKIQFFSFLGVFFGVYIKMATGIGDTATKAPAWLG